MPQLEKTLHGDLDEIHRKLAHVICSVCSPTTKRGTWTTTAGDVRCILTVFEKHSKNIWNEKDREWKLQPHCSMTLNLIDTGEEIRLFAITAGGSQELYYNPYPSLEGELIGALKIALDVMDDVI